MIFNDFYERTLPGGLKRGPHENYSRRFPEGVRKEEIQQWRQARSRPGEKETLNIMLRERTTLKTQRKTYARRSYINATC